ncbi:hypothetical protein [Methanobrevibacter sp.]|uniref:hypothetical protein n=1 Tax=Methanobrevibacter sp. TaxID=66852 RepID=UPI00386E720E
MKNNENVKERKSLKEVVVENKGKIIAGVSIVAAGAVGIAVAKNHKAIVDQLKQIKQVDAKAEIGHVISEELWHRAEVTEDIIVNSGIIDQARATIMRKKDNLIGKLNRYTNMEQGTPDIDKLIEEVKAGIAGFDKMLDNCNELEYLYKCKTVAEELLED